LERPNTAHEMRERRLAQLRDAAVEARVDGRGFAQHRDSRVAVEVKELQIAAEGRPDGGSAVGRKIGFRTRRFDGLLEAIVEIISDGEKHVSLAFEVEVERSSRDPRRLNDVCNTSCPVSSCSKDSCRCGQELTAPRIRF